ncbi:MAG: secretin N-terminal domain-containing protein [Rhodocyclaceae bacterium]|nr:secretin N-terminal domain-containing protein [Rhodocyclaceae bacterium]
MQSSRRLAILVPSGILLASTLIACSSTPATISEAHLRQSDVPAAKNNIPTPVQASVAVPRPRASAKTETYSVVVNNVRVQELLFALARDAKLNVDIHPGIQGTVTLNAIDQTLQQLLQRISKQVDMRWELDGPNLAVMPDSPFLRNYKVDYVNLTRDASGTISASSQISTSTSGGTTSGSSAGTTGGAGSNVSTSRVENKVSNHFWASLEKNIKDLLRETDKLFPEGSSETVVERSDQQSTTGTGAAASTARTTRTTTTPQGIGNSPNPATLQQDETTVMRRTTFREAASVIINAESGIVSVRATGRQHEKIQEFIDQVTSSARRQVMIEATILEVQLNDVYKQGINWSKLNTATALSNSPAAFTLTASTGRIVNLLEQFGDVRVLSSPKLSVLNNQSALLKVVENYVYFSVKSDIASSTVAGVAPVKAFTTTPQSVSVGLVMVVTPQISENNSITLNVRPSITSISAFADDPNPDLTIKNQVPMIRTREIESIMRVEDGEIAVLGGLMQERIDFKTNRVPLVGGIPVLGEVFSARENVSQKTELVIFLRPVVIKDPSVNGDYKSYRNMLPNSDFMTRPEHSGPFSLPNDRGMRP